MINILINIGNMCLDNDKKSKSPSLRFQTLLITHTLCLDDDFIHKIDPVSTKIIVSIIEGFGEIYDEIKTTIVNHQPNIQNLIYSNGLSEIKEKQEEVNQLVNNSVIYRELKQLSESNFNIFKNLYNTAKNQWKDFDMNEMRNFKALRLSNRCICNKVIEDNIILFHRTRELNLIIGNVCIDTFEWLIDTPADEITPSDFKRWKEKFFRELKNMKEPVKGKDKNDKTILKSFEKRKFIIEKMKIDRVLNDEEACVFDKYDSFKMNNKFNFEDFGDFKVISQAFEKISKFYCPDNKEYLQNYDIDDLIENPNIKFNDCVYQGYLDHFIKEFPENFHQLKLNNIFKMIEQGGGIYPVFIPDLIKQKTKKCIIDNINLDIGSGFVNYEFVQINNVIQCSRCNLFEVRDIDEMVSKCRPCYFDDIGKNYYNQPNYISPTILKKEDKQQTIKCGNDKCECLIEYNITKKCPVPYLTIKCPDCVKPI
jgi:hypothetical protein